VKTGIRLCYVNSDHSHPLYGRVGTLITQGGGRGPKGHKSPVNRLVRFDDGTMVVAPWGNWRLVKERDLL